MRINVAVPEHHISAPVLDAALEATTKVDESLLRSRELAPFDMRRPQARWKPEPPGQEHFDHGRLVQGRGWGDCDDLAPWHAASLRVTGRDKGAKAFVRKSGPSTWHALVRRSDGSIEDPSLAAGMPGRGRGVHGAVQPPMLGGGVVGGAYVATPRLAMRPVIYPGSQEVESWQARTDLPWHFSHGRSPTDIAMVSLHQSPISDQALVGALEGAIAMGEASSQPDEYLDGLRCASDMLSGADWEECARRYGPEHADAAGEVVGGLFGKKFRRGFKRFRRGLGRKLLKLAPTAASFIPGVGPLATAAMRAATPALKKALFKRHHEPRRAPAVHPAYQPQAYQPQAYQPQAYQPQAYQPQAYQPRAYQPRAYPWAW